MALEAQGIAESSTDRPYLLREMTPLTDREIEIVALYAEGLKAPEIGRRLNLSASSIRNYSARIRAKLEARTMAHAVAIVSRG